MHVPQWNNCRTNSWKVCSPREKQMVSLDPWWPRKAEFNRFIVSKWLQRINKHQSIYLALGCIRCRTLKPSQDRQNVKPKGLPSASDHVCYCRNSGSCANSGEVMIRNSRSQARLKHISNCTVVHYGKKLAWHAKQMWRYCNCKCCSRTSLDHYFGINMIPFMCSSRTCVSMQ